MLLHEKWYSLIGRTLRDSEDVVQQPLPRRWVELIRYLNDQERRSAHEEPMGARSEEKRKH
jgi:hypothetical protein